MPELQLQLGQVIYVPSDLEKCQDEGYGIIYDHEILNGEVFYEYLFQPLGGDFAYSKRHEFELVFDKSVQEICDSFGPWFWRNIPGKAFENLQKIKEKFSLKQRW